MVYPIVKFGDPVLEREAATVTEFDTPELHKFLDDMFESMYAAKGVGLAAPQIGVSKKIAVIDVSNGENPDDKLVIINPTILKIDGKQEGAGEQVFASLFELLTFGVLRADGDAAGAAHLFAEAGNAEAAFFAFLLALHLDDARIDEH